MKTTKSIFLALLFLGLPAGYAQTEPGSETEPETKLKVLTDLTEAKALAKKENKPVFLEFMSSTCGHCQAFKKNVLSNPEFITYANEKMVVVIHDYQELFKLPADEKKKREALITKLKVTSFPTIILIDNDGKILLRKSGYNEAPASKIIESLKKAQEQ